VVRRKANPALVAEWSRSPGLKAGLSAWQVSEVAHDRIGLVDRRRLGVALR
jgi:hypothetical protein